MVMVQMPVVQIIDMVFVLHGRVAASRSVDVNVIASRVHFMRHGV